MKVVIAGPRDCEDWQALLDAVRISEFEVEEVVSGGARGVDTMGEKWAEQNGVPIKRFPADWSKYGNYAGHRRNTQMAEYADALIALAYRQNPTRGTANMIQQMKVRCKPRYVHLVDRG